MTIKSSGIITMADIAAEFGGAKPWLLSQYYRGGARVPNIPANYAISTSGYIKESMFYGATQYVPGSAAWGTPGTYYLTVPAGVHTIWYQIVGGGGSGGGNAYPPVDLNSGGGGGGGGGYAASAVTVTPGETLTIVVGAGGPSVHAANGGAGGTTIVYGSFGSIAVAGGGGGTVGYTTTDMTPVPGHTGSVYGGWYDPDTNTTYTGWACVLGQGGAPGNGNSTWGGQGSYTTQHWGSCPGGAGGSTPLGAGGAAGTSTYRAGSQPGNPGTGYGGGGGGATGYSMDGAGSFSSGAGAGGYVGLSW